MTSQEIRNSFIDFFKQREHTFVPSSPVVPMDDPTLIFTNAGMNQFKDILLGKSTRSYTRAVNSQKCIRVSGKHNDLEEVGHDTYHHTFFEMLGNWSFGDYYKHEAILWAWELLTDVWKLPKDKLYATVFREDDEAADLWRTITDIHSEKILRFDEKDNFWEMGETGPCGPCSEIHIDLGLEHCDKKDKEHDCSVNGECGRYIELWNLVFIQYNRDQTGSLTALPAKHVDTGAGVGMSYHESPDQNAYRVIADHIRMLTFSIGDGAFPSNEGRGYVVRRILRRAARYGRILNMNEPFIYKLVIKVSDILGETFPEIVERSDYIAKVIYSEELW
jgi:alanyl-tRNA synthetase